MDMRQEHVGTYYLGWEQVDLYLREDTGGEFWVTPEKGRLPRIKVGGDYEDWQDILKVVLHEAVEFILNRNRTRYSVSGDLGRDHSDYLFVFNHPMLSECCGCLAAFIDTGALRDLEKAWRKWRKTKPKKGEDEKVIEMPQAAAQEG